MKKLRKTIVAQYLLSKNDDDGNPTAIYVIYDRQLSVLGWIEKGYAGERFSLGRNVKWLLTVDVSKKEIKRFKHLDKFPNKEY